MDANKSFTLLGIRLYGKGTFQRETVTGNETSATRLYPVIPGNFIYNRLFAWRGSFAVVPSDDAGCFVSNEFPQFQINEELVLPQFLNLLFLTKPAIKAVFSASVGSAAVSRNRFKEEEFIEFEFARPPKPAQKAIVSHWEHAQNAIEDTRNKLDSVSSDLDAWLMEKTNVGTFNRPWLVLRWQNLKRWDAKTARAAAFRLAHPKFVPLVTYAEEATQMVKPFHKPDHEWPVYGVNNKEGVFFSHMQLGAEFNAPYKRIQKDWFFHNPTRSSVGSLGHVPEVPEDAITSPEYQVWKLRDLGPDRLLPDFVAVLIRTKWFMRVIQFHRVGAVKQRLYVENLLEIPVPKFPRDLQERIASARAAVLIKMEAARKHAEVVKQEVEEMILGVRPVPTTETAKG